MPNDDLDRRETDWLFQRLNTLEDQMREQHQRLRSDMNAGFMQVTHEVRVGFVSTDERLKDHGDRILVIETTRMMERREAGKRGTWAGIAAASGLTVIWELLKMKAGWR